MDRVHRIGQSRPVRVIRFVMKDSIEERFIEVQDAKMALAKGSMERLKKEDRRKASVRIQRSSSSVCFPPLVCTPLCAHTASLSFPHADYHIDGPL